MTLEFEKIYGPLKSLLASSSNLKPIVYFVYRVLQNIRPIFFNNLNLININILYQRLSMFLLKRMALKLSLGFADLVEYLLANGFLS